MKSIEELQQEIDSTKEQLNWAMGELVWIIEDVWPLVHSINSRQTLRARFKRLMGNEYFGKGDVL